MVASVSAPLLSRLKSWQLVGLGITGWVTLYSVAILTWGASSALIGHSQGGCFATTMTLAGLEARRFNRKGVPVDPLQWLNGISTEHLNLAIIQDMQRQELRVEAAHPVETGLGFGVRAVKAGRTVVFETSRWKERIIDLPHAQDTEMNRKKVSADIAVLVGAGQPDEAARQFVKRHPVQFLTGSEIKKLLAAAPPPVEKPA